MFRTNIKKEDMENSSNYFAGNTAEDAILFGEELSFDLASANFSGPDDEEEEEAPEEEQDDNPPLDEEIVHSPVPTQSGGRPQTSVS
ncbi:MAG: hypothetical protein V4725_02725 [Bacteroidota bacterium]